MENNLILINFKNYIESIGKHSIELAKKLDKKNVWLIVNAVDLKEVVNTVKNAKVLVQHADPVEAGPYTGAISFLEVKKANADGVLLNHSEKRISLEEIKKAVKLGKKHKLKTVVCTDNLKEALIIKKFKPDYIALEPRELISGRISISESKPEMIKDASKLIDNLLVGAGIHTALDVRQSIEYGAKGILVSSAVVTSREPKKVLEILLKGFE
jgi:triosephosphate isomerase (TIM)